MAKGKQILIVDDDQEIRELLKEYLTRSGFDVLAAAEGGEMYQHLASNTPDLIILDYYFTKPDASVMNGMEVFDRVKEIDPDVLVIMLSAQERGEIVLELARKGIDDYVIKDNNLIDNLNSSLTELFGRKQ